MIESGIGLQNPLFFIGVVENERDPRAEGRVQVRAFGAHGTNKDIPRENLPWAVVVKGDYTPNGFIAPQLNDFVFGVFIDGRDAQQPMVLGLIPTQMTEPIDPEKNGWGVKPGTDSPDQDRTAEGSVAENYGQPQVSREARGEYVEETYVLEQSTTGIEVDKVADGASKWREPGPAYNAEYPYNKVFKTSQHIIELDDTPNQERIMIWHKAGAYVQIDANGTTTHKATGDKYEVNSASQHVYIGGKQNVTVMGHSHIYYDGNVTEEINGNFKQIIHGNHYVGVGGEANFNVSDRFQLKSNDMYLDAHQGSLHMRSKDYLNLQTTNNMNIKANNFNTEIAENSHFKSNNLNIQAVEALNILGDETYIQGLTDLDIKGGVVKVGSDGNISIQAGSSNWVYIDPKVDMADGNATAADDATESDAAEDTTKSQLPEPPAKTSSSLADGRSIDPAGSGGIDTQDDGVII